MPVGTSSGRSKRRGARSARPNLNGEASLDIEPLLTPEEVANILSCSRKTVYVWAEKGVIAHVKLGRLIRFRPADVHALLESSRRDSCDLHSLR